MELPWWLVKQKQRPCFCFPRRIQLVLFIPHKSSIPTEREDGPNPSDTSLEKRIDTNQSIANLTIPSPIPAIMLHKLSRLPHGVSRDVIDRHLAMNHVPAQWKWKFIEYHLWPMYRRCIDDPYDEYNEWVDQENARLGPAPAPDAAAAPAPDAAAASAASSQNIVPVSSEALVVLPSPQRKKPKKRTITSAMSPEAERETKRRKKSSDVLRASFNTDCDMAESKLLPTFNKAMGKSKNIRNQVGEEDRAVKAIERRLAEHDDKLAEGRQMVDDQKDLHRMERLRQEAVEDERIKAAVREEEDALARYEAAKENTKAVTAQAAANNEVYRRDNEIRDADVEEVWVEIESDADRQASHYNKELIKAQGKRSNTIRVDLPARIRDLQRLLEMPGLSRCHPQRHQEAEDELKLLLALEPMADVGLENKVHFRDVHPKLIQEFIDVKSRADVMRLRVIETSPESATSDIVGIFKVLNDKRYFENEHYLRLFTEDEGIKKDYPNGPLTKFPTCNSSYSADKWKQMLIDFLLIE